MNASKRFWWSIRFLHHDCYRYQGLLLPCQPATSSVLSQAGGIPVASTPINETFNSVLPASWAAQNLSSPGATGWFQGNTAVFGANSGTGYIAANFNNTTGLNTISNWLFTPKRYTENGDKFSFYTRQLQVHSLTGYRLDEYKRYQCKCGTTNTSVGDYSTPLLDINQLILHYGLSNCMDAVYL